jgi:Arc/MetJ-type ribon-helix-helix transcriptional regulator
MKQKISVSIEEEKVKRMDDLLKTSKFRNKSHVVEIALEKLLEEEK